MHTNKYKRLSLNAKHRVILNYNSSVRTEIHRPLENTEKVQHSFDRSIIFFSSGHMKIKYTFDSLIANVLRRAFCPASRIWYIYINISFKRRNRSIFLCDDSFIFSPHHSPINESNRATPK